MARGWPIWSILLVILAVATAGCQDGGSSAPPLCKLIIDYDEAREMMWFYLSGVEQIRFDQLSIELNGSVLSESAVFALQRNTTENPVNLLARAEADECIFVFNATLTVEFVEDGKLRLHIEPGDGGKSLEKSLPHTIIIDKEAKD